MNIFSLIAMQSIKLSFRKGGGAFGACAFYIITVTIFTFAIGPNAINTYAKPVMCIAMLLSVITTLPLLFERDYEDGTLEQLLLQPVLLEILVAAKISGQWFSHIIPIIAVSPLLALMSGLSIEQGYELIITLFIASVAVVSLGAIGAALTIGSKRGGLLQALIVMPLYVPVLIFAATGGQGAILFLTGLSFFSIPFSCYICSTLIRIGVD